MMIGTGGLRKGLVLEVGGTLFELLEYEHFKTGKGNSEARIRLRLRNLRTGEPTEKVFQTSDHFHRVMVENHEAQFLYEDGELYHFMDSSTFEQFAFSRKEMADLIPYLKEGLSVELLTQGTQPVSVRLPRTVDLKVVETSSSFKGDTAVSGTKPARLETGVTVQVPLFINAGTVVKIDTRTGQYVERVN